MAKFQKVVWYEGMKLDPHHFQQLDRYFQYNLNSRINSVNSSNSGFSELEVDTALLANGSFNLTRCRGVMPDGMIFNMPENDPLPKPRPFEEIFEATQDKLEVLLVIPLEHITGNNCQLEDTGENRLTRYNMQTADILDDNTGENLRQVGIVRPNFTFKFGEEVLDDFTSLKIGEITRSSDGSYVMNKNFIPTSLMISASEAMYNFIREILSGLVTKSKELQNQINPNKRDLSITDVEIMLLAQTVNTFIPLINQYYNSPHYHPEVVYSLLLNLGGQLATFMTGSGIKPVDFQPYDHKNQNEVFRHIYNQLMTLLNIQKKVAKPDIVIPLKKQSESLYVAELSQEQIDAQLYLVVRSSIPESKLIAEFPRNLKIASQEEIFAVHQAGMQGVTVEYISRPPSGLSVDPENHYFKITKQGRFWDKIVDKQTIAFFIATEFSKIDLSFVAFLPGR